MTQYNGRTFEAPGPGAWELDSAHFPKAISQITGDIWVRHFGRGFAEGTRLYGVLLDRLEHQQVHGFLYVSFRPVAAPRSATRPPPRPIFKIMTMLHPQLRQRIRTARTIFKDRSWLKDLHYWDHEVKPQAIREHLKIQNVDPDSLSSSALIDHLNAAHKNAETGVYRHGRFTMTVGVPMGDYLNHAAEWTGLEPHELLLPIKGFSDVSIGLAEVELDAVAEAYRCANDPPPLEGNPSDVVASLRRAGGALGQAMSAWISAVGYHLVTGYDITDRIALELPETLVGALNCRLANNGKVDNRETLAEYVATVRDQVPGRHHDMFDQLLTDAQATSHLREERDHYNDGWAMGLLRHAILAAGRKLVGTGKLSKAELLLDARFDEACRLLSGSNGVTEQELQDRADWRASADPEEFPDFPWVQSAAPLPSDWLPDDAARVAKAIDHFLGSIFVSTQRESEAELIRGIPVSPGVYEGRARLILGPQDFSSIEQGDVLLTRATSPYFNLVLPLLGGIITDRGGALSHAAIVAREYGIPGVVGTKVATSQISNGAWIRIDGAAGTITVLKNHVDQTV